eukprot:SAG31_NODE_111_length_24443_cov_231.743685_6_plen_157_part_00
MPIGATVRFHPSIIRMLRTLFVAAQQQGAVAGGPGARYDVSNQLPIPCFTICAGASDLTTSPLCVVAGTTVYMLQNYGCPETLLGVFNQTNRGDVSTCHISGIPDHPAAAAPPIDVWTIANFDGATQPKTASAVSVQFVLRSFVAAGLPTAWALLW